MAEKLFNEKIFSAQSNYGFGLTFNATGKAPLIAKRIFSTYADAEGYALDEKDSAVPGLMLTVIADSDPLKNGLYFVKAVDGSDDVEGLVGPFATIEDVQSTNPNIEYDKVINESSTDDKAPTSKAVKTYVDGVKSAIDEITETLSSKVNAIESWKLSVIIEDNVTEPNFGLSEISHNTIYLVPEENGSGDNVYKEYIYVDNGGVGKWELLGEIPAVADLSGVEGRISALENNYKELQDSTDQLKTRVDVIEETIDGIVTSGGEANLINGVSIDGTKLTPDASTKIVNIPMASAETNGIMSKEHFEKLESIDSLSEDDIERAVTPPV